MAFDDPDALRQRVDRLEEEIRKNTEDLDTLQRVIFQSASDFRTLSIQVEETQHRVESMSNQISVMGRSLANLLARVERLERGSDTP